MLLLGLAAFASAAPGFVEQQHVLLHSTPVVAVKHVAVAPVVPVVKTIVPVVPVVKTVVPVVKTVVPVASVSSVVPVVKSYVPVHHVKTYAIAASPYAHYYG